VPASTARQYDPTICWRMLDTNELAQWNLAAACGQSRTETSAGIEAVADQFGGGPGA